MPKLKKAKPTTANGTSSKLPRSTSSSTSPIHLRSSKPAPARASTAHVTGETSIDGGSSLFGSTKAESSIARSHSSNSLQHSTPPNSSSIPTTTNSSSSDTSPATVLTSLDTSPAQSLKEEDTSALFALRRRIEADEEARRLQAQSEKEAPRKLVKKSRRSAAAVGASDGASVLSYDYAEGSSSLAEEEEGNLLEEQEPTNMVYDETNMDDLDGGRAIAEPFVAAPHVPSTPTVQRISAVGSGGPVYLLLALPRFGLHAAQTTLDYSLSTTRSIALLPFHVASHLPLIGGYVPFSSSSQSTTAFAPREPSSASEGEPRKAGIVWQAAELGLGLTIAGVLVAGAGASMMWDTLGGGKRKARA